MDYDYWELRKIISKVIPRKQLLFPLADKQTTKIKGRKVNYEEFNLISNEWEHRRKLLKENEVNSFLEISLRAAACPMPLNLDVWDGLKCPFGCIYCYANAFRTTLYSSFFDNSKSIGLRHCDPDYYKKELDKIFLNRGKKDLDNLNGINKAVSMEIPMRFGIRFEDFLNNEKRSRISLELLKFLNDNDYPVMINTKSSLIGDEEYVKEISENKGGSAVHITMISNDEKLLSKLEPGAPTFAKRLSAAKNLIKSGVRVVARIEPFLVFINDNKESVLSYIDELKECGIKHITFDTYSYSAKGAEIKSAFNSNGFDYERLFLAGCDSQPLGSYLLGKFIDEFRIRGFSCSTFDMGNVPSNDQNICCEVADIFSGFNWGCSVGASRFIKKESENKDYVGWKDFEKFVERKGGWLTDQLKLQVHELWNLEGKDAYSPSWSAGLEIISEDEFGLVYFYNPKNDFRKEIIEGVINGL